MCSIKTMVYKINSEWLSMRKSKVVHLWHSVSFILIKDNERSPGLHKLICLWLSSDGDNSQGISTGLM